jgi:hypothetical protein
VFLQLKEEALESGPTINNRQAERSPWCAMDSFLYSDVISIAVKCIFRIQCQVVIAMSWRVKASG